MNDGLRSTLLSPKTCGKPLDGSVLRNVALAMADGQLEQADRWRLVADGRAPWPRGKGGKPALVQALEHLRSANGWLTAAAEHTQ